MHGATGHGIISRRATRTLDQAATKEPTQQMSTATRVNANGHASLPPGPPMPTPLQALGWATRPLPLLAGARRRYGDTFTMRIRRRRPWVFLSDPEDVGKVLTISPELVRAGAGEANPLLRPLLGPRSVMLLDEPDHMTARRFILPSFHGQRMRAYGEMMVEVARREIATWPVGQPFALWPRMQAISNEVVMRATFGHTDGEQMLELRLLLGRLTNWLNDPARLAGLALFGSRWLTADPRFKRMIAPVERALLEEVRRRRAARERPRRPAAAAGEGGAPDSRPDEADSRPDEGILGMLEQAYDENGTPMTDRELRDELITLLSDGPTATSMSWAFERLLRHPDKMERLRQEVLRGEQEDYVEAVCKEILRLCPAVPLVMRGLVQPMQLGGYEIPAGTIVAPAIYLVHHREDIYPHPFAFMPERYLDGPPANYTWIPFGSGVRRCVAATFAPMEIKLVIQTVLREVELGSAPAAHGTQRPTRSSVSFAPADQAPVIVKRRLHAPTGGGLAVAA